MWRAARIALGVGLLLLGLVGLVLPVLQGTLFLILGLTVLARESARVRRTLAWVQERAPHPVARGLAALRHEGGEDGE